MIRSLAVIEMHRRIRKRKDSHGCDGVVASTQTNAGRIDRAAWSRLAAFRAEQRRPFSEDSADLIREAREERYQQL
jgi:hypothetical protein